MAKSWFYRNIVGTKSAARIVFGIIWLVDASFKLQPSFAQGFSGLISGSAAGQPAWLAGWFTFWSSVTSINPTLFAYSIAIIEFALAFSLIFGFMRKIGYISGFVFSLMIWSVPEGFGGPYGPSSTDIGTGIVYALVFLMLMVINAIGGTSRYSIDGWLEKKFKWWHKFAEFS
ncbi:MAG: DoxX family membrane protein [Nitrososphaeria archaeon]